MRRRALGLFFICSAIVPLAIVSTAWACGVLATLSVSPNAVSAGQVVTATGVNYSGTSGQPVTIKWNSRTGPTIGSTIPDPTGKINAAVTIPSAAKAGSNLVLALQNNANGTPKSGTPGRTTVQVAVARSGAAGVAGAGSQATSRTTAARTRKARTACVRKARARKATTRRARARKARALRACARKARARKGDSFPGAAWGPSKPAGPGAAGAVVTLDGAESASPALLSTLLGGLLSVGLLGTGLVLVRRSRTAKPALGI